MPVRSEKKKEIIASFHRHKKDSGSPEIQVALLTEQINNLSQHLKANAKDVHSRFGLLKMVGRRKRHLDYLRQANHETYQKLISRLDLRK